MNHFKTWEELKKELNISPEEQAEIDAEVARLQAEIDAEREKKKNSILKAVPLQKTKNRTTLKRHKVNKNRWQA